MKETKNTPGPWIQPVRYSPEDAQNLPVGAIEDASGRHIAVVCLPDVSTPEWGANARLIAAAPDLLEACLAAEYITPKELRDQPWFIRMRDAISKAQGK